ncbi:hypothetical protein J4E96_01255 [Pengzhenrongella sicca]|uniref:Type II secretion system protein GspF domain-containing protein n=1 Tax=Pengzhenrongella sicca TaxID=2819238 RepID=A0A8A4ZJU5_9MICO|nr:hypothetical protein J4E96_01255 [Pengzhenrongella sicca]
MEGRGGGRAGVGVRVGASGRAAGAGGRAHVGVGAGARGRAGAAADLAVVVVEVASQLRAGADPRQAWERTLGVAVGPTGLPRPDQLEALVGTGGHAHVVAVLAAGRLAGALGAPLAPVLERVAAALGEAGEAEGERRAALAGPRSTAWVLTALPVLGVALGAAVGADPIGVLLGGGAGTAALLAGLALLAVGRWWIARLVRAAVRRGTGS